MEYSCVYVIFKTFLLSQMGWGLGTSFFDVLPTLPCPRAPLVQGAPPDRTAVFCTAVFDL